MLIHLVVLRSSIRTMLLMQLVLLCWCPRLRLLSCSFVNCFKVNVWLHMPQQFLILPWPCWSSWWCLLIVSLFIYFIFTYIIETTSCLVCKKKIANARTREVIIQVQNQDQPRPEQAKTRPRAVHRRGSPSTTPQQKAKLLAKTHEKGPPWGKIKAFL